MENLIAKPKILIVEDDQDLRSVIYDTLSIEGAAPNAVSDGESALEALERDGQFDTVILDLNLPKMSGWEVLETIHLENPNLPVVILTASADPENRRNALAMDASDYTVNPVSIRELIDVLERHVGPSSQWGL